MKHISIVAALSLLSFASVTASCRTESSASGRAGTRLSLSKPVDQSMAQGESNRVAVTIGRTGFADPVNVTFSNLPHGVRVDGDVIPEGDSKKTFVLVASPDAGLVSRHIVTVQASGAGITTSQTFELTVSARG